MCAYVLCEVIGRFWSCDRRMQGETHKLQSDDDGVKVSSLEVYISFTINQLLLDQL